MRKILLATASLIAAPLPSLADAAPPPLEAYGELPSVEDIAISPSGNLATIAWIAGMRRIVTFDPTGRPTINAPTGDAKIRGLNWADDDILLITNSATVGLGPYFAASKYELSGTLILSVSNPKPELVFAGTSSIANTTRGSYGIRRINGKTVGYFGGIGMGRSMGNSYFKHGRALLYAVDLPTNRARQVASAPAENHYRDWLVDTRGQVAATLDIADFNGSWQIENANNEVIASGISATGDVSLLWFGYDGSTVIYATEDEDGSSHWFEVPLAGGQAREILADVAVSRTYVDPASSRMLGYRERGDEPKAVMADPKVNSTLAKIFAAFPGRRISLKDWTPDFSKILVRTEGNRDSGTWFKVDLATRKALPIGDERPAIGPDDVGPISRVSYTAADGLEMDGILTLPPGREAKNLPVIMLPHGGPSAQDDIGFDWWAQAFASRGYAVFQPNFRGSTNRDDAFRHAGDGQWGRKMQTDITDGLAELVRQGIVDPRRACIVGASYGGYAALAGVTLQHGFYRCAVSVAGVSDVDLMYQSDLTESGRSRMTGRALRAQLGDSKSYEEISPRRFADNADAPVQLIHGKDDTVVPFKQSAVMADALKDAGKPYEMVVLDGEDHWLSRSETRKEMLSAAMRFVQEHNPAN
ncbi:prolyl oligopeptidase family serine peptidase [Novosphingobium sp. PY1]|uniref:alpha/beta hydrolase family protein n=1 Tax=Novosphingobium sp. PY1 TaxID=1882221 RepID=UPI0028048842|nr:prolyl oligopeptidase family serine peptidase [Novosphingobium sp. PY1]